AEIRRLFQGCLSVGNRHHAAGAGRVRRTSVADDGQGPEPEHGCRGAAVRRCYQLPYAAGGTGAGVRHRVFTHDHWPALWQCLCRRCAGFCLVSVRRRSDDRHPERHQFVGQCGPAAHDSDHDDLVRNDEIPAGHDPDSSFRLAWCRRRHRAGDPGQFNQLSHHWHAGRWRADGLDAPAANHSGRRAGRAAGLAGDEVFAAADIYPFAGRAGVDRGLFPADPWPGLLERSRPRSAAGLAPALCFRPAALGRQSAALVRRPRGEDVMMGEWYENLFRRVLYPVYETGLRRRHTLAYLKDYRSAQWLAPEQIAALQWKRLKALLEHCYREVPYYRQQWRELGIVPEDIRSMDDYARLPLLTKDDIRTHGDALKAESLRNQLGYKATGGSTGEPMRFGFTRESNDRRTAVMWRGYEWAGSRMGRRTLFLWGGGVGVQSRTKRIKDRFYN